MLKNVLISTNNNLDKLIEITIQDIKDIKEAKHDLIFTRNEIKEKLVKEFMQQKNEIDRVLLRRSEQGISLENILSAEEDRLFSEFKNKLQQFYEVHKKFSRMALLVANFYNNLMNRVNQAEVDIGYKITHKYQSNFSLKV